MAKALMLIFCLSFFINIAGMGYILGFGNIQPRNEITKEEAVEIIKKYFKLSGGCYIEDRGDYWFGSPPYILERDIERAGIYIDKKTGEIKKRVKN